MIAVFWLWLALSNNFVYYVDQAPADKSPTCYDVQSGVDTGMIR